MKSIIIIICLQFSLSAHATLCSAFFARRLKIKVDIDGVTDKWKHCSLSCMLARRCGTEDAFLLGIIKELADVVGPGNAEWADLNADADGVTLYRIGLGRTDQMCKDQCETLYPPIFNRANSCPIPNQDFLPYVN